MCLHTASIESTVGNVTKFFPSPFLNNTSRLFILAGVFQKDYIAAGSTALRSATEQKESGSYVTFPYPAKAE